MAHQQTLATFKTVIAVQDLRRLGERANGTYVANSSQKIRVMVDKYFMDDPNTISARMGCAEEREKLKKELLGAKNALAEEFPPMKEKALALAENASRIHKGTFLFAVIGGIGAAAGFFADNPGLLQVQFIKNLKIISPLLGVAASFSLLISAAFALVAKHSQAKCGEILEEAKNVQQFIESAVKFVGQEWRSQIMDSFRR